MSKSSAMYPSLYTPEIGTLVMGSNVTPRRSTQHPLSRCCLRSSPPRAVAGKHAAYESHADAAVRYVEALLERNAKLRFEFRLRRKQPDVPSAEAFSKYGAHSCVEVAESRSIADPNAVRRIRDDPTDIKRRPFECGHSLTMDFEVL